jgi:hypothetical protein
MTRLDDEMSIIKWRLLGPGVYEFKVHTKRERLWMGFFMARSDGLIREIPTDKWDFEDVLRLATDPIASLAFLEDGESSD